MHNPFTNLLIKIELKLGSHTKRPHDDLLMLITNQVRLLKVLYRSMLEFDLKKHINTSFNEDNYENYIYESIKSNIDYLEFINILNQFGRILKNKYDLPIPKLNRINFFRNKVSEHWEEYTEYGMTGSQLQYQNEAAIPSINTSYLAEERKKIKIEIDSILNDYGLILDIENSEVSNIAHLNTEKIYAVLEQIDPTLNARLGTRYNIPDSLVRLLFCFGFPAPIEKVTEYSAELVKVLENKLELD